MRCIASIKIEQRMDQGGAGPWRTNLVLLLLANEVTLHRKGLTWSGAMVNDTNPSWHYVLAILQQSNDITPLYPGTKSISSRSSRKLGTLLCRRPLASASGREGPPCRCGPGARTLDYA